MYGSQAGNTYPTGILSLVLDFVTHYIIFTKFCFHFICHKGSFTKLNWKCEMIVWSQIIYLLPATKLGQGYVFTRVCDSLLWGVSQHALQVSEPTPRGGG